MAEQTRYTLAREIVNAARQLAHDTDIGLSDAIQAYIAADKVVGAVEEAMVTNPVRRFIFRGWYLELHVDDELTDQCPITWLNEDKPNEPPDWDQGDGCYGIAEHGDDFYDRVLELIRADFDKNGMAIKEARTIRVEDKEIRYQIVRKPSGKKWGKWDDVEDESERKATKKYDPNEDEWKVLDEQGAWLATVQTEKMADALVALYGGATATNETT